MLNKLSTIALSNGRRLPLFGLGTWQATDESQLETALRTAFDCGYRYIDTAEIYKNEHVIGRVVEEYVKAGKFAREDVFITTKLPLYGHADVQYFIDNSLKNLRTNYIDLYLMHCPMPVERKGDEHTFKSDANGVIVPKLIPLIDSWRVMEKNYQEGKLKSIGISNFNEELIKDFWEKAEVKPQNLQVECHILFPQKELVDYCKSLGITVTAYAPIGSPGRFYIRRLGTTVFVEGDPMKHPLVVRLGEKYKKSPAQILLRQIVQRGISVIPKSTNPERLKENGEIFDFELTKEEMDEFDAIAEKNRLFLFDFVKNHPWHPWKEDLKAAGAI